MSGTLRAASTISGLTLLSRILGLVRDSLMMGVLGAGWVSDTFLLAWLFPNLFRRFFGEGALSASFIPAYASMLKDDPGRARQLLAGVSGTLITVLGAVTALVLLLTWMTSDFWAGSVGESTEVGRLLADLVVTLFPYVVPICLVAIYAGSLNSHGSFALPAVAPVVLNCFWIAGIATTLAVGISEPASITRWLALFLLCGGMAQLALVVFPLLRRGALSRPVLGLPKSGDPARGVFRAMVPTVIGLSAVQANALVDQAMAFFLIAPGALSYIYLANRLLLFPLALTSVALATAVFPSLSVMGSENDRRGLRSKLDNALSASLFFSLPAAVGLAVLSLDVVQVLFQHGEFTATDARETTLALMLLVLGLPFVGSVQLHARAFYALGDMSTPARIALRLVLVNLGLNLIFVLGTNLGAAGLTLATSLSAMVNATILRVKLRRACAPGPARTGALWRSGLATAVMGIAVWVLGVSFSAETTLGKVVLDLGLPIIVGVGVYGLAHLALRSPELRRFRRDA